MKKLNRNFVLNIILDGVAIGTNVEADAFHQAKTPTIDKLRASKMYRTLYAHGTYVGMPTNEDMGNSEVGHNAIGSGQIYTQGAKLVEEAFKSKIIFQGKVWKQAISNCRENGVLHLIGLVSDGNVHSHIRHLEGIIEQAAKEGCKKIVVHALLDGRDTPPHSSILYIDRLKKHMDRVSKAYGSLCQIASIAGRMVSVMDRYESDWQMVERGWQVMVQGKGDIFTDEIKGIQTMWEKNKGGDQHVQPFLVADPKTPNKPNATINDGDTVIFFNFRGDRALEICRAFESDAPIKKEKKVDVFFAGMMQYDGDNKIPTHFLVDPPNIQNTMGEYLIQKKKKVFAISETQKFGHVTYFWNGNKPNPFDPDLETYLEIKGNNSHFDQEPWMKATEITNATIRLLETRQYDFGRINYPNGDMVGHTGDFEATRISIEAVDLNLGRLLQKVKELSGIAIITADHGNSDEMYELDKKTNALKLDASKKPIPKTSHSLNPVPFMIYDPSYNGEYHLKDTKFPEVKDAGIANIAATTLELLGIEAPDFYQPSLIVWS